MELNLKCIEFRIIEEVGFLKNDDSLIFFKCKFLGIIFLCINFMKLLKYFLYEKEKYEYCINFWDLDINFKNVCYSFKLLIYVGIICVN